MLRRELYTGGKLVVGERCNIGYLDNLYYSINLYYHTDILLSKVYFIKSKVQFCIGSFIIHSIPYLLTPSQICLICIFCL